MPQNKKVLVVGGAGQAGSIHVKNLISLGATVASFDLAENPNCETNFNAAASSYSEAIRKGFTKIIVALPDHILFSKTTEVINSTSEEAPIEAILVEKPGSLTAKDLQELVDLAQEKQIPFFIDYQRSFDPRLAELGITVSEKAKAGFDLEYVSVYSCDKAQPPQAAHQALNQGCHDYAMLLFILKNVGLKVTDLSARGVRWGSLNDTRFLKITGEASKVQDGLKETTSGTVSLFDVQMGRVSTAGTFTEMYVKMSKFDKEKKMYVPFEASLKFPEIPDPTSSWADTWSSAFKLAMKSLIDFGDHQVGKPNGTKSKETCLVPAKFGVEVLEFAERALNNLRN
eukprot:maker-scaffold_4-snap-gene-16.6-mRNA-1 protein AED:0.00 eAED:0.00 QI:43/1/1/1/1/1/6/83/341